MQERESHIVLSTKKWFDPMAGGLSIGGELDQHFPLATARVGNPSISVV